VAGPLTAAGRTLAAVAAAAALGCAPGRVAPDAPGPRPFRFAADTFAFVNESHWVYVDDPATGERVLERRSVHLALHCAGVARAARQFLVHARFDPTAPAPDADTALRLARAVLARDPRVTAPRDPPIAIPGYPDLRTFSGAHDRALKDELLRDWRSVIPRGDWRIVVPYTPGRQARIADALFAKVAAGTPAVVRVVKFPVMTVNHAVLVFRAEARDGELAFTAYDPNDAGAPITMTFDHAARTFLFPPRHYFAGGPVTVYEIYAGPLS
jgi:hypothetical protein